MILEVEGNRTGRTVQHNKARVEIDGLIRLLLFFFESYCTTTCIPGAPPVMRWLLVLGSVFGKNSADGRSVSPGKDEGHASIVKVTFFWGLNVRRGKGLTEQIS